ncbi:MAG: GNAT family N-acetyltransferase [Thermoplasmata archaeon HGW-Thermoplasmata-2]|nr:MAG: GNAT family N-acetyltransferase [Thermoplasmata archaeon HGW-Thermoplasmata-2]
MKIREATEKDLPEIVKIGIATWRTTYAGMIPAETLANMSQEWGVEKRKKTLAEKLAGTKEWHTFVAEDDNGKIVGFIDGGPQRGEEHKIPDCAGELYAMYVLKAHQQKGVGRQLFLALVRRLLECKMNSMVVHVLEKNPSRKFYEKIGGEYLATNTIEIGGAKLEDVIYGWKDLRIITQEK